MKSSLLRRTLALCLTLLLLMALPAHAETAPDPLAALRESILSRAKTSYTEFAAGDRIDAENQISFAVDSYYLSSGGEEGSMVVDVLLTASLSPDCQDEIYMADFDFVLVAFSGMPKTPDNMLVYTPTRVLDLTNEREQELLWPVALYNDRAIKLDLVYEVPSDLMEIGILQTNALADADDGLTPCGPLYGLTFTRGPLDFNLVNGTSHSITKLEVAPTQADEWGTELLYLNGIDALESGYWSEIYMDQSTFADSAATEWAVCVTFDNGDTSTLDPVDIGRVIDLTVTETDGKYAFEIGY